MSFYVVANLKSHKTKVELQAWVSSLNKDFNSKIKVIIAPSFPYFSDFGTSLSLAAQDVSPYPQGSYTGAVNATQLSDSGVKFCLVGHSERRRHFHETVEEVGLKISELLFHGITPIVCLRSVDIASQFNVIDDGSRSSCFYLYEPEEDIGNVVTAPLESISAHVSLIRQYASGCTVLYGGSVNTGNIRSLINLVDGVVVGTASLDISEFNSLILETTKHV